MFEKKERKKEDNERNEEKRGTLSGVIIFELE